MAEVKQEVKDEMQLYMSDNAHFSFIRKLHIADLITLLNGFCGVMAIQACLAYCLGPPNDFSKIWAAIFLCPFGLFFDFMDGKVARWRGKTSLLGAQLDSLADLISFGVAPSAIAFSLGLQTPVDSLLLTIFVLCGLGRLARFNVTAQYIPHSATGKANYFEGTPIPTSLSLVFLMAVFLQKGYVLNSLPLGLLFEDTFLEFHPLTLIFNLHGAAMLSRSLRVPKL